MPASRTREEHRTLNGEKAMYHFRAKLAATVCAAGLVAAPVAHGAILNISVFDNGTLIGSAGPSTFGVVNFTDNGTLDPNFASIQVQANGPGLLPNSDLSSVTLDISASTGFTGPHVLDIEVYQTGVLELPGSKTESTFTVNNLIGTPGPTTLNDFFNGTSSTLGTFLAGATFPAGTVTDTVGPIANTIGPALTADAQQYLITFNAGGESANDTIQLTTSAPAIPEPSTWALMLLGFAGLGFAAMRRGPREAISAA
jgi:hypothetical protein